MAGPLDRKRWPQGMLLEMLPKLKHEFLTLFERHPNVSWCCDQMSENYEKFGGIKRTYVYAWIAGDDEFREAFQKAKKMSIVVLEEEMHRRALEGDREEVFDKNGCVVGYKRKFSDRLLQMALRAVDPERYGNQAKAAPDVEHVINLNLGDAMTLEMVPEDEPEDDSTH